MRKSGSARIFAAILITSLFILLAMNCVLATEEQELKSELLELISLKNEMQDAGIGTERISDLINEGYAYLSNQNYNKTREAIISVHKVNDLAFSAKSQLSLVKSIYAELNKRSISLFETTPSITEWNLNYSQREFENENFEEALGTAEGIRKSLLKSISARYSYLNNSISALEEKIYLLRLDSYRVTTIKSLLAQALDEGKLEELDMIEKEVENVNTSISYYEEVKLSVPDLESGNLSAKRIIDGLAEAKAKINIADYLSAVSQLESLKNILERALELKREETEFEKRFDYEKAKIQVDWSATEKLVQKARYELSVGNYEEAEKQLAQAKQAFESTKAHYLIEGATRKTSLFSLKEFVARNWQYLLAFIIIIIIVLKLTQKAWSYEISRRNLIRLEKELKVSEKMIQELQKKYFVHRKMSRENYDEAYEDLQNRVISLKEKISMINKKIKKTGSNPK